MAVKSQMHIIIYKETAFMVSKEIWYVDMSTVCSILAVKYRNPALNSFPALSYWEHATSCSILLYWYKRKTCVVLFSIDASTINRDVRDRFNWIALKKTTGTCSCHRSTANSFKLMCSPGCLSIFAGWCNLGKMSLISKITLVQKVHVSIYFNTVNVSPLRPSCKITWLSSVRYVHSFSFSSKLV